MFESLTTPKPKRKPYSKDTEAVAPVPVPAGLSLREAAAVAAVQGLITFHGHALRDDAIAAKARTIADLLVAELAASADGNGVG